MDWAKSGFLCSGPACLSSTALDENFAGAKYFLSGFASTEAGKNGVRFCIIPPPSGFVTSLSCLATTTAGCSCWVCCSFGEACDVEMEEPRASQVTGLAVGDDRAGGGCGGRGGGISGGTGGGVGGGGGVEAREEDDENPDDLSRALLSFLLARA